MCCCFVVIKLDDLDVVMDVCILFMLIDVVEVEVVVLGGKKVMFDVVIIIDFLNLMKVMVDDLDDLVDLMNLDDKLW